MNASLVSEHKSIAKINDLNSVLLEGDIVETIPPLKTGAELSQVILRSSHYNREDARKNLVSFVQVDVSRFGERYKTDLCVGRKVRVVGRIIAPRRKPVCVVAEHIELKPKLGGA